MSQSTVLPPVQSKAADIAAQSGRAPAAGAEVASDGESFGAVLQSQMDKGAATVDPAVKPDTVPLDLLVREDAVVPQAVVDPAVTGALVVPILPPPAAIPALPTTTSAETGGAAMPAKVDGAGLLAAGLETTRASAVTPERVAGAAAGSGRTGDDVEVPTFERQWTAAMSAEREGRVKPAGDPLPASVDGLETAAVRSAPSDVPAPTPMNQEPRREPVVTAPIKVDVAQPLASPAWRDGFADRVAWVANARQTSADMQINPPSLGPVEIRVSMNNDQANLSFFSPHAAVRDAIQAALPRLTDSLAASGLTLGNVFVGAESQSGHNQSHGGGEFRYGNRGDGGGGPETPVQVTWMRPGAGPGRVDLFA